MTPAEAIETWNADQLRARRAYRLEPTAIGKPDCVTCDQLTGTTYGCPNCKEARAERRRRARRKK